MTVALLALGLSVLAWPAPRRGELRLRGLIDANRLAGPVASLRRRRILAVPSRGAAITGGGVAGLAASAWRGPVVGLAAGAATALVAVSVARAATRRIAAMQDRDLSIALRLLRAELDVGSSGGSALRAAAVVAGDHRPAFDACAQAARDGDDPLAAMSRVGGHIAPELTRVVQAWSLADALGVPLADVLARVDEDVQARRAQARVVASALAGPRSSAALLAGLPVLGILLGTAMQAHPLGILFDTPGGRLLLCVGVLLDVAGVVWTGRLIVSAERS